MTNQHEVSALQQTRSAYCYSLGFTAAALLGANKTSYIASVRNLTRSAAEWVAGGKHEARDKKRHFPNSSFLFRFDFSA